MAELGLVDVTLTFGGAPLLDGVQLQVERGERVGLLGRNGAGKSTLLAVMGGRIEPDGGEVTRRQGLRVGFLPQEVPRDLTGTVAEVVAGALDGAAPGDPRVERTLSRLSLEAAAEVAALSAGTKRRVLLARALVQEPDLLLLDEPTNHLDLEAIARMEELLLRHDGCAVFVTHDRRFLTRVATRIVDLDRGRLQGYRCDYATYLERRDAALEAEAEQQAQFDKKLAQEEAWLRRGIKARRTRNQGRVRALQAMRRERGERRERTGTVRAQVQEAGRSGQLVLRTKDLAHSFEGHAVVGGLTTEVLRGDRVGILGPNGCGKTTLLRLLLGELTPDSGSVELGTGIELARFDQLHGQLDESKSVQENICDDGDTVTVGGRSRHVMGYLQDFLFTPEQVRGPVDRLSGGERNKLQLARLFARPCNLLVLDEPTNDLDVETLELLESLLVEFEGTLLLVSHDREFLDNVVTSTLAFEGEGRVHEYAGGYEDWLRQRAAAGRAPEAKKAKAEGVSRKGKPRAPTVRKLSFREKQELDKLPARIEELEEEQGALEAVLADPAFYKRPGDEIAAETQKLERVSGELEEAYARWEELEEIAAGS